MLNSRSFHRFARGLAGAAILAGGPLAAQGNGPARELGEAELQAQLARVEASDLDAGIKDGLKEKLNEVAGLLKSVEEARQSGAGFREAVAAVPAETAALREQIEAMAAGDEAVVVDGNLGVEELRAAGEAARLEQAELAAQLEMAEAELARMRGRPMKITARLPRARAELSEVETRLAGMNVQEDESLARTGERMLEQARRQLLAAEVEMLVQEQASQAARENRQLARRDLLERQLDAKRAQAEALGERLIEQIASETYQREARIEELAAQVEGAEAQERVDELRELAAELETTSKRLEEVATAQRSVEQRRETLRQDLQRTREQVELGLVDGSVAQILIAQRRRLPDTTSLSKQIQSREGEVRELMMAGFKVDEKRRGQAALARSAAPELAEVVELRRELLLRLRTDYAELVRELSRLEVNERSYRELIEEVRAYLSEKLFWRKSAQPLGVATWKELPAALVWVFAGARWEKFRTAVAEIPVRMPLQTAGVGLGLAALLGFRRRIVASLESSGKRIRRISTDRFVHTLRALLCTVLLALPLPLAVGFLSFGILSDTRVTEWDRGFGVGLFWASVTLIWALLLREICRPDGLGQSHFRWGLKTMDLLRRAMVWLLWLYVPFLLGASMTLYEASSRHFDSAGRLGFMIAHLGIAGVFARFFSPTSGVFSELVAEFPDRLSSKLRNVWYFLLVGSPLALVVLAAVGYLWTAVTLSAQLQATLRLLTAGVIVYGLLERWFMMKQRRIALKEALAARQMRKEEAEKEPVDGTALEVEIEEPHLDEVARQARRLLRALVGVVVVVLVWMLWAKTLPLSEAAKGTLGQGFGWLSLLKLIVLIPISYSIVKNLPGLIELLGLRTSGMDSGVRYAVTTICQYVVIAAALGFAFKLLNLDWSKFGWIAAALSVGLGFGLQEVVANFVCGIILLFERPIRIGDVVSLGEVTGTVTKIQMRATTITNWDRKDFIVPNKQFITGSLMNWTLSSPVNRVVIPVGVAYGSDTARAREILVEIAEAHPLVMKDPKPLAAFEAFADSTLNLSLRCFLPDMDQRLRTTSELHEAIDERFKKEGIEMAFPQRDLHLRSVEPGILARGGEAQEKSG